MKLRSLTLASCWVLLTAVAGHAQTYVRSDLDLHALFSIVGKMYGLDPSLLEAVAKVESAEQPEAISPKGAQGLMQLMPGTAERFGVIDPMDPVESALGAARFLRYLVELEGVNPGALPRILAAYNAGENAVQRHGGIPPYQETQDYVRRVLWLYLLQSTDPFPQQRAPSPKPRYSRRLSHEGSAHTSTDANILQQLSAIERARARAEEGK
jgi:soluble lytic murein transglycosylase-like protein